MHARGFWGREHRSEFPLKSTTVARRLVAPLRCVPRRGFRAPAAPASAAAHVAQRWRARTVVTVHPSSRVDPPPLRTVRFAKSPDHVDFRGFHILYESLNELVSRVSAGGTVVVTSVNIPVRNPHCSRACGVKRSDCNVMYRKI